MRKIYRLLIILLTILLLTSCSEKKTSGIEKYKDKSAEEIVMMLTLEEKAAQMVQPQIKSVSENMMRENCYGSILSKKNSLTPMMWRKTVDAYQKAALESETAIPYLYGQDDVHGVNYALDTVIFPHNIGLGAANDPDLMYELGLATADEAKMCHMLWNFAPVVAQATDPRWGRTYESYGTDLNIIKSLSSNYTKGLIDGGIVACAKHYLADGNVEYGTGENSDAKRLIDRGDASLSEEEIAELLDVYKTLIDEGVQTVMVSHSSLNGIKMHENEKYISYLKNEMGFEGFVVSDWNSVQNTSAKTYKEQVINCINAGIDMLMEVDRFNEAMKIIVDAVNNLEISEERINDAVTRIIRVKINEGLFIDPLMENLDIKEEKSGSKRYRALAEKLVEESLVLIKNQNNILPLKEGMKICVMGPAMKNAKAQCGGWTIDWNGSPNEKIAGVTTVFDGIKEVCKNQNIELIQDLNRTDEADAIILVVGEEAYAEWLGDSEDIDLCGSLGLKENKQYIQRAKNTSKPIITLIIAGRNVIIEDYKNDWDAIVMCYLPGSEARGIANVLCGLSDFKGRLASPWYSSTDQIKSGECWLKEGYGLTYNN